MKTTKEMIEVMKAFDEGKPIQLYSRFAQRWFDWDPLEDENQPSWNWEDSDYRIKPKPKKRPMTFEEIVAYQKEHRTEIITYKSEYCTRCGYINGYVRQSMDFCITDLWIGYSDFIENSIKEDGTRFEVEDTDE